MMKTIDELSSCGWWTHGPRHPLLVFRCRWSKHSKTSTRGLTVPCWRVLFSMCLPRLCLFSAVFLRLCGLLSVFRLCVCFCLPCLWCSWLVALGFAAVRLPLAARPARVPPSCSCFAAPCVLGAVWCAFLTACPGVLCPAWLAWCFPGVVLRCAWRGALVRLGVCAWGSCGLWRGAVPCWVWSWPWSVGSLRCFFPGRACLSWFACSLLFAVCSHVSSKFARPGAQVLAKFVGALAVSSEAAAAYHRCRKGVAAIRGRGGVAFVSGCRLRLARLLVDPARASFPVLAFSSLVLSFVLRSFARVVELSAKSYTI